jgi:hypothetical protein
VKAANPDASFGELVSSSWIIPLVLLFVVLALTRWFLLIHT